MIYFLAIIILFLPIKLLYPTKVLHKERMIKRNKRAIITSNHYSNLDGMVYSTAFLRKFRFMAKIELFKNKFIAFILKRCGIFPVNRENFSPAEFKKTLSELKKEHQVFIFPEGKRNLDGTEDMLAVKRGIILFASKGEAEIVPMLMYKKPKIFRKNYIIVGNPIKIIGENPSKLTKEEIEVNINNYVEATKVLRKELNQYIKKGKTNDI